VFSLEIILLACLNASIPFNEFDSETSGNMIMEGKRPSLEGMMEEWKESIQFIISCWESERERRIKLRVLMEEIEKFGIRVDEEIAKDNIEGID
jgi:hypothetical protein